MKYHRIIIIKILGNWDIGIKKSNLWSEKINGNHEKEKLDSGGSITNSISYSIISKSGHGITSSKTYTLNADFDEGILSGVEHSTVADQLQLSSRQVALPFIWVPNYDGTVSKIDTSTGNELGRYRVSADSVCDPSRTTVDINGNCWVGLRQAGTVVKIGLSEAGKSILIEMEMESVILQVTLM